MNRNLKQLPVLNGLTALQTLRIANNENLIQLSDLSNLMTLQELEISMNENLKKLPLFNGLTALKLLKIFDNEKLTQLPALSNLIALQELDISANDNLKQLPIVDNLQNLTTVKVLQQKGLNDLHLHKLISLKKLFLSNNENTETESYFAKSLNIQRQQQGLNTVEVEFANISLYIGVKTKKLRQAKINPNLFINPKKYQTKIISGVASIDD